MTARLLALVLLAGCAPSAHAQVAPRPEPADRRPESAKRLVASFDFEEKDTNPDPVPRYWIRGQDDPSINRSRPGFPNWNTAELDFTVASGGIGSVILPTRGGSTSLILERGVIPIFAGADYQITARTRTADLKSARAVISASFLDAAGQLIPGTESRSLPAHTDGSWINIQLEVLGNSPKAAYLQLELLLLQPDQLPRRIGDIVPRADVKGAAWFDDIKVLQLPRIELTSTAPGNCFVGTNRPTLTASVRDLTGEDIDVHFNIFDAAGRVVATSQGRLESGRSSIDFTPSLPAFGWYSADVGIFSGTQRVGFAQVGLVWVPALPQRRDPTGIRAAADAPRESRFGLLLHDIPPVVASQLASVLRAARSGSVVLPAWTDDLTAADIPSRIAYLGTPITQLLTTNTSISLSLPVVPADLARAAKVDADDVYGLFSRPDSQWAAWIDPFLDRFGQRITRWQIGSTHSNPRLISSDLTRITNTLSSYLSRLVPGPTTVLAWPEEMVGPTLPASVSLLVRTPHNAPSQAMPGVLPSTVPDAACLVNSGHPDAAPLDRAAELARRMVELWIASHPAGQGLSASRTDYTFYLPQPWILAGPRRPQLSPTIELAVWRTMADRLSGRRVIGTFPAGDGITCYILAPDASRPDQDTPRTAALVLWADAPLSSTFACSTSLGQGRITFTDLFGNTVDAHPDPDADPELLSQPTPPIRLPVSRAPLFIEGIDLDLVRFISSVRIDPRELTSSGRANQHAIRFENPWRGGLSAKVTIVQPGAARTLGGALDRSWTITPRISQVTVPASSPASIPFTIGFGSGEEAGPRPFIADFDLIAERQYGRIRVRSEIEIALQGLALDVVARRIKVSGGEDIIIEATLTNTGSDVINAEVTTFMPGEPRERRTIAGLQSGAQSIRRFVFRDTKRAFIGKKVVVTVNEPARGGRISRSVELP
ncbi:MAG: hypothetical protein KGS45_06565 [Planctomycetes bacterium]|nr:hypothetical protein [Planctomycetota bacterium]